MTGLGNMDDVYNHYLKVIEENKQLRQLLKECSDFLENLYYPVIPNDYETNITNNLMRDILSRIYATIGESEK